MIVLSSLHSALLAGNSNTVHKGAEQDRALHPINLCGMMVQIVSLLHPEVYSNFNIVKILFVAVQPCKYIKYCYLHKLYPRSFRSGDSDVVPC